FAVDGCVNVRGRLHRLDHGTGLTGSQRIADFRQFDEYQIAERFLGMIRDADDDRVTLTLDPFVTLEILPICRELIHEIVPRVFRCGYSSIAGLPFFTKG